MTVKERMVSRCDEMQYSAEVGWCFSTRDKREERRNEK